jgi:aspartate aminotransferase
MSTALRRRLDLAREVLAGTTRGERTHPSMLDPDVISLAHGDGTRRPHASVIAAGVEALISTTHGSLEDYLFQQRHEEFEEALRVGMRSRGLPAETTGRLAVDSGTTRLFEAFLRVRSRPGDLFLVPRSYYHPLPAWCELSGVELALVPTVAANEFKLTPPDLAAWWRREPARAGRARGLFLFNPTQTGALYTIEELRDLAATIADLGLVVLEDNVFAGTEFPGRAPVRHLAAVAPDLADRVVTVMGASKALNLANLRIGWACGPAAVIDAMNAHRMTTLGNVPHMTQSMALAALRAPAAYLEANSRESQTRAALVTSLVAVVNESVRSRLGGDLLRVVHQPQAGHGILVAADGLAGLLAARGGRVTSIEIARFLLAEAKVAVSPGLSLGFEGTAVRVVFGSVGLKQSHAAARPAELAAVRERVLALGAGRLPAGAAPDGGCEEMFASGRRLIERAFLARLLPAVERILPRRTLRRVSPPARHAA